MNTEDKFDDDFFKNLIANFLRISDQLQLF